MGLRGGNYEKTSDILFIALLLVLWWIGVWGLIETLLHTFIRGSTQKAILVYSSLIATVILIVWAKPQLLEHFV
jgi:hypothetical protein